MPVVKRKDWYGWWDGLRSKSMRAGAEALATNIAAILSTNGFDSLHIPGMDGIGMHWKTAIATTIIQFMLRVGLAAAIYVQNKPDPDVVEETIETTTIKKTETVTSNKPKG